MTATYPHPCPLPTRGRETKEPQAQRNNLDQLIGSVSLPLVGRETGVGVPMSTERARQLRRNATAPERAMWRLLYPLRHDHNFRRQVPLGSYYADFACHALKLVIEIDGDTHGADDARFYDAARTRFIEAEGYRVIRFTNDAEGVFDSITMAIKADAS